MKKIIGAVAGVVLVVAAGLALWIALDSSAVAATVGKTKITAKEINDSINEILAERKTVSTTGMDLTTGADLTAQETDFYVLSQLLEDTAAENGLKVTPAQMKSIEAIAAKESGGTTKLHTELVSGGIAFNNFDQYLKEQLILESLTKYAEANGVSSANSGAAVESLVSNVAKKEGVTVSPKFGVWDPTQVAVETAGSSTSGTSTK